MRIALGLGCVVVVGLVSTVAHAECAPIVLAEGVTEVQIDVQPKAGASSVEATTPQVKLKPDGKLLFDTASVVDWLMQEAQADKLSRSLTLELGPGFEPEGKCAKGGKAVIPFELPRAALQDPAMLEIRVEGSKRTLCKPTPLIHGNPGERMTASSGSELSEELFNKRHHYQVDQGRVTPVKLKDVQTCGGAPPATATPTYELPADGWCAGAKSGEETVCLVLDPSTGSKLHEHPGRNVVAPNHGLFVVIAHPKGRDVTANWAGTPALTRSSVTFPERRDADDTHAATDEVGAPAAERLVTSSFSFAPRAAGAAKLTVTSKPKPAGAGKSEKDAPTGSTTATTYELEIVVDTFSWGAVRFGFAGLFGDAVSPNYEIRNFAGATQTEIAQTDKQDVNFEVVLGFSPYLLDMFIWGGRSHAARHIFDNNTHIAPYIGLGIVGQSASGVDALTSIYAGAEIEITSTFSIAGAAVWRRVNALADGYAVGAPADVGTAFTVATTGFGFALVLNATPDFLQFATPSSSSSGSSSASESGSDDDEAQGDDE